MLAIIAVSDGAWVSGGWKGSPTIIRFFIDQTTDGSSGLSSLMRQKQKTKELLASAFYKRQNLCFPLAQPFDDDILFIEVAVLASLAKCLLQEPLWRSEKAYPGTSGRQWPLLKGCASQTAQIRNDGSPR